MVYDLGIAYRAKYWLYCIGNNNGNAGILQSLRQVGPPTANTGTERTSYASLNQYKTEGGSFLNHISMSWEHVKKKKLKTQPSADKVMCTFFWDKKGVILLDFLEPKQAINSERHIRPLTKLNIQSGQRKRQLFSCNTIMQGSTAVQRPWSTLPILAALSYHAVQSQFGDF